MNLNINNIFEFINITLIKIIDFIFYDRFLHYFEVRFKVLTRVVAKQQVPALWICYFAMRVGFVALFAL